MLKIKINKIRYSYHRHVHVQLFSAILGFKSVSTSAVLFARVLFVRVQVGGGIFCC